MSDSAASRVWESEELLVLAFGNKAAEELRQRYRAFPNAGSVTTSTFHALGLAIISLLN